MTIEDSEESQVLVVCYADSGMARLIQYIASAADLDEWHLHATEIFSGLLKDTSPMAISKVDPQKDALRHVTFERPCVVMDECSVEVDFYLKIGRKRFILNLCSKTQFHA